MTQPYAAAPTGVQTSQDVNAVIPVVLSRAREVVERPTILTKSPVVTRLRLEKGKGRTINIPRFTQRFVAETTAEGVPISKLQKLVPDMQSFSTYEIGVATIITKQSEWYTPEPIVARAGRYMGAAIKRRQEEDMISLFSLPTRTIGAPGSTFNPSWLAAAEARLAANTEIFPYDPASKPIAIVHPYQLFPVLGQSGTIGSNAFSGGNAPIPGWTEDLIRNYDIKQLYGVPVAKHIMLPIDANDDAIGCVFARDAFVFIDTPQPFTQATDEDILVNAIIMVARSHYGVGFMDDQFAISLIADASTPTG